MSDSFQVGVYWTVTIYIQFIGHIGVLYLDLYWNLTRLKPELFVNVFILN